MRLNNQAIFITTAVTWLYLVGTAYALSLAERTENVKTQAVKACGKDAFADFARSDWENLLNRATPKPCAKAGACTQAEVNVAVDTSYSMGPNANFLNILKWSLMTPFTKGIERCDNTVGCWKTFATAVKSAAVQLCIPNHTAGVKDYLSEMVRNRLATY